MANTIKAAATMDLSRSRYVVRKRADGVSVVRPSGLPMTDWLKGVLVAWILLTAFKALVLASVGATSYEARVASLMEGTVAEGVAGWIFAAGPATKYIANGLFPIF